MANDEEQTTIRVEGPEGRCREFLNRVQTVVEVTRIRGPYPRRRGAGVMFYADAAPRQANEPGA